jgi:hypothetical protein
MGKSLSDFRGMMEYWNEDTEGGMGVNISGVGSKGDMV